MEKVSFVVLNGLGKFWVNQQPHCYQGKNPKIHLIFLKY